MFEIMCKERFKEAMELSREHRDQTFSNCMMRLLSYLTWNNADKVRLTRNWDEHCFNFAVLRADGSVMLNGGVISTAFLKAVISRMEVYKSTHHTVGRYTHNK